MSPNGAPPQILQVIGLDGVPHPLAGVMLPDGRWAGLMVQVGMVGATPTLKQLDASGYDVWANAPAQSLFANPAFGVTSGVLATVAGPFDARRGTALTGHLETTVAGTLYFEWSDAANFAGQVTRDYATQQALAAGDEVFIRNIDIAGSYGRLRFLPSATGSVGGELLLRVL